MSMRLISIPLLVKIRFTDFFPVMTILEHLEYAMAGLLEMLHGLKLQGKKGASFGSYGWAPTGLTALDNHLANAGITKVLPALKANWVPDEEAINRCRQFGKEFVEAIK